MNQDDILIIGWCDNGSTDSLFTSHLSSVIMRTDLYGVGGIGINQSIGNQIARQRQDMLENFIQSQGTWLLSLDSDVIINPDILKKIIDVADKDTKPVVCGVYFISYEPNEPLMTPLPALFKTYENGKNKPIHPLPENQVIPVDMAGLGFCLIHRSVIEKLLETYITPFDEQIRPEYISEDISFFTKLKELGIPIYAHTGALAWHIKRFVVDINYYNLWWSAVAPYKEEQEKKE